MPAFYYFATADESLAMLSEICEGGFRVIPDDLFDRPVAPTYDHVTADLAARLEQNPAFYLTGPFNRFPIRFIRLKIGPAAGSNVIDQGPLMDGMLGRLNVVDGMPTLLLGDISYQSEYENPETGQWEKAPAELKNAHRFVVSRMKKRLVKHEIAKFAIGPEALRLVLEGYARLKEDFL